MTIGQDTEPGPAGVGAPDASADPAFAAEAIDALRTLVADPSAEFRDGQLEAITAVAQDRKRVLVVQRTGWGKSAVYFVATQLLRRRGAGPTLIVSPLLALMRNQIEAGERGGVRTRTINSDNRDLWDDVIADLDADAVDLLLVSPERFANPKFRDDVLPELAPRAGLLVVDEVHCVSDWGHDFRPDYRRINRVLDALPRGVPVLGTTATANDRVIADIAEQFGDGLVTIRGPLERESLVLDAQPMPSQPDRLAWLATVIPTIPGTGIVYCLTVADAERVAAWLHQVGVDAAPYTGATDPELRKVVEDRLARNDLKVVVATSALGMGYDKPDLGFVIHYQAPGSPIAYYQQVGRAGRAVDEAQVVLLSGHEDRDIQDFFITTAFPPQEQAEAIVALLDERADWVRIGEIEEAVNIRRGRLTAMLKILEVEGAVERDGTKYRRTLAPWEYPVARVEHVTAQRRHEQEAMRAYLETTECLMQYLRRELDDPGAEPCGRCSRCTGRRIEVMLDRDLVVRAQEFLRGRPLTIEPRKMRAAGGRIPAEHQLEEGRALSQWGDGGWGRLVREQRSARAFGDELVHALVRLVRTWRPEPAPAWIAYVPSSAAGDPVRSLAHALGRGLALPVHDVVAIARPKAPQREMANSAQQVANLDGAFTLAGRVPPGPVLLVDDTASSRWTLTTIGAMLREAGSGPVHPVVLALLAGD